MSLFKVKYSSTLLLFLYLVYLPLYSQVNDAFSIPASKGLSEQWISALRDRGEPEIWSGEDLKYIGMPVGGIACGQLYLGGDGRLWLWDIFKSNYSREDVRALGLKLNLMTMNGHYTEPVLADGGIYSTRNGADVDQGFIIRINTKEGTEIRSLDRHGFPGVEFRGEWPLGRIKYCDQNFPLDIHMEAFSPFIPLDPKNSALPATVILFRIKNNSNEEVGATILGWLQNATCPYDNESELGERKNNLISREGLTTLYCDIVPSAGKGLDTHHGYGSMALSLISEKNNSVIGNPDANSDKPGDEFFEIFHPGASKSKKLNRKLVGSIGKKIVLGPGEQETLTFLLTWYFPLHQQKDGVMARLKGFSDLNRHYKDWFTDAYDVALYIKSNYDYLVGNTVKWNKTWYNSTLPYWFLDRTMIPTDALATQTVHWFDNGRFWGWEGVESCAGTCTHVWNYAQALARLFPGLERDIRKRVDYGIAFDSITGAIGYRGEINMTPAIDGHAGVIIRTWREHTMTTDNKFLEELWPDVKKAAKWLISNDPNSNGMIEGAQKNTLDASWYGPNAWISSVYCAALKAAEQMAIRVEDLSFADSCGFIADRGYKNIPHSLFNGEYFIHKPPDYNNINSNNGCHIDQVLGQSWAIQTGLPRVLPEEVTRQALNSIWKYNSAPDAGTYAVNHKAIKGHRVYASEGEAGLIMATWPYGGDSLADPRMNEKIEDFETWLGAGGYFDECMTGFEYQVAAHMIYEGEPDSKMVRNGLAVTRAIHDRYSPEKRNPYNEIECGDHYARAMAAFGVYLAACGFKYNGPEGTLGFDPKVYPGKFRGA
ncbi:MAG TPA: hypothetical protein DEQ09_01490, partial [Bacteroidales bacterium]|nr:hypothetical protein [Bacteroidales bacterium]